MKTKGILLAVMLLILMNSTIFGLEFPTILSLTENQTKILSIQEREVNLKPHQDLGARSHRVLQKSAASAFPQYEEHEPIVIKSDVDFVTLGFPGDGSPENPYVIERLNITRSTTPLIQIKDTTVYFHIRNNFLNGLTSEDPIHDGIHLIYVSHGTVASNIITNCEVGILIEHSKDIIVSHNTVSNNTVFGIHLSHSEYNIISHNTIFNNSLCGICVATSGNNTVSHNIVSNASYYEIGNYQRPYGPYYDGTGIYLSTSGNNTVSNNTISNNSGDGIHLWNSSDTIISYNTVLSNGGTGIFIEIESG
ncbi:MAG: nitrous oxide reductase family maturation protein NosD, partial [Candidatus Hodarchaeota archaeon]